MIRYVNDNARCPYDAKNNYRVQLFDLNNVHSFRFSEREYIGLWYYIMDRGLNLEPEDVRYVLSQSNERQLYDTQGFFNCMVYQMIKDRELHRPILREYELYDELRLAPYVLSDRLNNYERIDLLQHRFKPHAASAQDVRVALGESPFNYAATHTPPEFWDDYGQV